MNAIERLKKVSSGPAFGSAQRHLRAFTTEDHTCIRRALWRRRFLGGRRDNARKIDYCCLNRFDAGQRSIQLPVAELGAVFFGFFPWAFSVALQYTTAARGAIGIATIPIQTLIVAAISGREPLTRRNVLSVALGFAGIATVFGPEAFRGEVSPHWLGDGLMLIGALSAAIYSVFGRPVFGRHGAMFVMVLAVFFGLLTLTLLAAASGVLTSWPTFGGSG
jgi:drug/metabolite transporter (DMT)-like permease